MDSVVSWAAFFVVGVIGFVYFMKVYLSNETSQKEYKQVKSMSVNLNWGDK